MATGSGRDADQVGVSGGQVANRAVADVRRQLLDVQLIGRIRRFCHAEHHVAGRRDVPADMDGGGRRDVDGDDGRRARVPRACDRGTPPRCDQVRRRVVRGRAAGVASQRTCMIAQTSTKQLVTSKT